MERSMTTGENPEIGATADANGIKTNYLEAGKGDPVVLIHGSGPGVTSYANWRLVLPALAENFRVLAPDMVGFGFSERPANIQYGVQTWADQVVGLMDTLELPTAHLVGNSFGGAIALRIATQHPDRVGKLVLMGSILRRDVPRPAAALGGGYVHPRGRYPPAPAPDVDCPWPGGPGHPGADLPAADGADRQRGSQRVLALRALVHDRAH
jgi:pimeloyl-ACP methyl ester carboxylesterase